MTRSDRAFTLIELSIVLVVIGLIIGGILVGRDLIKAAEVRATITQLEKFQTAVATFKDKFGALPGDVQPNQVAQFGFTAGAARSGAAGNGDGNGEIDGLGGSWNQSGENLYFWEDLSTNSGLIEGTFNAYSGPGNPDSVQFPSQMQNIFSFRQNQTRVLTSMSIADMLPNASPPVPLIRDLGQNFFGMSIISQNINVSIGANRSLRPRTHGCAGFCHR